MKEIWKDVVGYEGLYSVSSHGRVRREAKIVSVDSVKRKPCIRDRRPYYLKINSIRGQYNRVVLFNDISKIAFSVHRLVCEAFIPNPENKPYVNHKNGVRYDNNVENLEWVTAKENHTHAIETGLDKGITGENNMKSKLNNLQVRIIRRLIGEITQKEIGKIFGVKQTIISKIKLGLLWHDKEVEYSKYKRIKRKGSEKPTSKLTEDQVIQIRKINDKSCHKIAKIFGVSYSTVYCAKNKITWKHI